MKKILLFPFNGNAKEAVSVIEDINAISPQWDIIGFIDDAPEKRGSSFGDYHVLGDRSVFPRFYDAFVLACPGRPENFLARCSIVRSLDLQPDKYATIIHPSAVIGVGCTINANCLVMANVVLTANVTIGSNVVILPNTVISHDCAIGDWTMIGSNVSVSGGVSIGENCYIGTGSKIKNNITIEAKSMVGIGSVVINNVGPTSIVAGNPARNIYEN